ncbi:MAG TPA: carboxypeptidase regulatory-like domain-containing protein [Thermoanaerobaculia bacterium]
MSAGRTTGLLVLAALLLAAPLAGQAGAGGGRVAGVVAGPDGEPLAGARVTLAPRAPAEGGPAGEAAAPPAVVTGEDGRWTWVRLQPGAWEIRVEATGYLPAEGWVQVPAPETVRIELQSLDEVPPVYAEGDPAGTVLRWLRRGDALLDQGRPAEAGAEYEKVLGTPGVLSDRKRAEVLEALARASFQARDRAGAERALQAALLLAPAAPDDPLADRLRLLFTVLLEGTGRDEEARRFLARLEREPEALRREHAAELAGLLVPGQPAEEATGTAGADAAAEAAPPIPDRPVLPPEPHRRGRYRTAFAAAARSPLSDPEVVLGRYGGGPEDVRDIDPAMGRYDLSEETFEVYVPSAYRPAGRGGSGWGLVVWVSPTSSGGIEDAARQAVLGEERLLWVGANDAGNPRFTWNRVGLALDAAHAMAALYDLDPQRIYAAGYSGGGRIASALGLLFPEVFGGALSLFGASFYRPVPVPDRPGSHWPAPFPEPPSESLRDVRREGRFVLVTGERDFNRAQTRATARVMEEEGFRGVTYLEIPGATHYDFPGAADLRRALEALEAGPAADSTPE